MTHIPLGNGAEFDLIRRILADPAGALPVAMPADVRVGPGDDCAVVRGEGISLSVDMSVEGVHFRREWLEPEEIGYRAAASALSDLAAVAARPIGILAALAIQSNDVESTATRVMDGVRAAAAGVNAVLLGGDITRIAGPMVIDVVVVGNTARPALRTGARPGDSVWVTGELGAAAAAVRSWSRGVPPEPASRLAFALPQPRVEEAIWLVGHGVVNAMIDLSDGLAGDAGHLAAASGVGITIDLPAVPIHPSARLAASDADDELRLAISGGEDYELCFAAPPGSVERVLDAFGEMFDVKLTCVGVVHDGQGVHVRDAEGRVQASAAAGFDHFSPGHR